MEGSRCHGQDLYPSPTGVSARSVGGPRCAGIQPRCAGGSRPHGTT